MKIKKKTSTILAAAVTGLLIGASTGCNSTSSDSDSGHAATTSMPSADLHACAGKNACEGKGGCKSGDNGCKGKNSCKTKGGCAVKG